MELKQPSLPLSKRQVNAEDVVDYSWGFYELVDMEGIPQAEVGLVLLESNAWAPRFPGWNQNKIVERVYAIIRQLMNVRNNF